MNQDFPFQLNYDYPDGAALAARFPYMFNKPNIGFDFFRGWQPILAGVCIAVDELLTAELGIGHDAFAWTQIKEKYGTARLYFQLSNHNHEPSRILLLDASQDARRNRMDWSALSDAVNRLVDAAETATETACMACGAWGQINDIRTGWITTLCAEHRAYVSSEITPAQTRAFWEWAKLPGAGDLAGEGTMILFLDFDGVVHPEPCTQEEAFISLPLIEAVLREFPQVDIVISSAWRLDYANADEALQGLKLHFSQDIQHRVVGITGEAIHMPLQDIPLGLGPYSRQAECVAWLRQHRPSLTPWLALDDRDYLFRPSSPNLMLLDGRLGFRPEHQEVLRTRIQTQLGDPS